MEKLKKSGFDIAKHWEELVTKLGLPEGDRGPALSASLDQLSLTKRPMTWELLISGVTNVAGLEMARKLDKLICNKDDSEGQQPTLSRHVM